MSTGVAGVGLFPDTSRITRVTPERSDPRRASLPTEPERPDSPEERKSKWDESCRSESARVAALAEENRKKREADARQRAEDERQRLEVTRERRDRDERRKKYFEKIASNEATLTLAFAPYAPTAAERQVIESKMNALDQGVEGDLFSPEAWVIALLELRSIGGSYEEK